MPETETSTTASASPAKRTSSSVFSSSSDALSAGFTPVWVWWAVGAVITLDQVSKYIALKKMAASAPISIIPGFLSLVLTFNTGAAFSFLASSGGWQRYLFACVAVLTSAWLIFELRKPSTLIQRWGILLVLGGAIGNLVDRIWYGHVVDFIFVYWRHYWSFSVFNVADISITIGVALLILGFWKQQQHTEV